MKGWADHCSSDEEDHDAHEKVDLHADDDEMKEEHHLQEETPPKEAPPEKPKTYDYPTEPPCKFQLPVTNQNISGSNIFHLNHALQTLLSSETCPITLQIPKNWPQN